MRVSEIDPNDAVVVADGETRVIRMKPDGWALFRRVVALLPEDRVPVVAADEAEMRRFVVWLDVCGLLPDGYSADLVYVLLTAGFQIIERNLAIA